MGLTFTIGGVAIAENSIANPRVAIHIQSEVPVYDISRYHIAGTDGNLISRNGRTGQRMVARIMYIGTVAVARGNFKTDKDAWANTAVTIVDDSGVSYTGMNLTAFKQTTDLNACGRPAYPNYVYFETEAVFTKDN